MAMDKDKVSNSGFGFLQRATLATTASAIALSLLLAGPSATVAQDKLSKFLLIKLSREQSAVLCGSEIYTQCMGFSADSCTSLSEKAIDMCLSSLPDTINLSQLDNDTLEACPRVVYEEAGYNEGKALACLQKAM